MANRGEYMGLYLAGSQPFSDESRGKQESSLLALLYSEFSLLGCHYFTPNWKLELRF